MDRTATATATVPRNGGRRRSAPLGGDDHVTEGSDIVRPDRMVVVLLDSLNRHLLGATAATSSTRRTSTGSPRRSMRFDRHYTGSLPCMPARHDLLVRRARLPVAAVGLDRAVGGADHRAAAPRRRRRRSSSPTTRTCSRPAARTTTCDFTAWDYVRGHEGDPWRTPARPVVGRRAVVRPGLRRRYDDSSRLVPRRGRLPRPAHDGGGRRVARRRSAGATTRFLLFVDEFDPHEPFDTPEPWASRYDDDWRGRT